MWHVRPSWETATIAILVLLFKRDDACVCKCRFFLLKGKFNFHILELEKGCKATRWQSDGILISGHFYDFSSSSMTFLQKKGSYLNLSLSES